MHTITVNPLNGLISKEVRPRWMCKHPRAELIDRKEMIYMCRECNSSNHIVKVIPTVRTGSTSPKKVSISPDEGFKVDPTIL
jgi:hypothetical protein